MIDPNRYKFMVPICHPKFGETVRPNRPPLF